MKRFMALLTVLALIFASSAAFAGFPDVPSGSAYEAAIDRVSALGIMEGTAKGGFEPQNYVSREQFAVIMVRAAGLDETALSYKGSTVFADVNGKDKNAGYIQTAVNKGFLTAMPDGRFHPGEKVTFAQLCTVTVKALGYTDQDVTGLWPKNYMDKARSLGLTEGIGLKSSDGVRRFELAVILDRLLMTVMKKGSPSEVDKTYAEAVKLYTECILLENSVTSDKLAHNQVLTDKGIFYLKDGTIRLEPGNLYRLMTDNDTITRVFDRVNRSEAIVATSMDNTRVFYKAANKVKSFVLSEKTVYYYRGVKQNYDTLKNSIQTGSTLVLTYNRDNTGIQNVVIYDPNSVMEGDNADFALVLDNYVKASTAIENYGKEAYYIKLLHIDGTSKVYKMKKMELGYNGQLVRYKIVAAADGSEEFDQVEVEKVQYLDDRQYTVDKEKGTVDDSFITDNIRIFNIVHTVYGGDSSGYLMDWSDLPNGAIPAGKIKYIHKTGDFEDINVLYVDNILDEESFLGIVTKVTPKMNKDGTSYTSYTVLVDGKEYTTTSEVTGVYINSIVSLRISSGSIFPISRVIQPWVESETVNAIDSKRIKVNGKVYEFSSDAVIYFRDYGTTFTRKGTGDIIKGQKYGRISLYFDQTPNFGGKVKMVIVTN